MTNDRRDNIEETLRESGMQRSEKGSWKEKIYETRAQAARKYVRCKEGAEMYGMGLQKFQQLAKEAGATYKIDRMVLVNIEKLEAYLETFAEC